MNTSDPVFVLLVAVAVSGAVQIALAAALVYVLKLYMGAVTGAGRYQRKSGGSTESAPRQAAEYPSLEMPGGLSEEARKMQKQLRSELGIDDEGAPVEPEGAFGYVDDGSAY